MNKDIIAGNWQQLKGKAQAKMGEVIDEEIKKIMGG